MELKTAIENIRKKHTLKKVFSLGIFNRFENCKRIYLDRLNKKGLDLFIYLVRNITSKMKLIFRNGYFVCILSYSNAELKNIPYSTLKVFKIFNIKIPKDHVYIQEYCKEDEIFLHYLFFRENPTNLEKLIWFCLSRNFTHIKPYSNSDIFFFTLNTDLIINLYDDRGIDILILEN